MRRVIQALAAAAAVLSLAGCGVVFSETADQLARKDIDERQSKLEAIVAEVLPHADRAEDLVDDSAFKDFHDKTAEDLGRGYEDTADYGRLVLFPSIGWYDARTSGDTLTVFAVISGYASTQEGLALTEASLYRCVTISGHAGALREKPRAEKVSCPGWVMKGMAAARYLPE